MKSEGNTTTCGNTDNLRNKTVKMQVGHILYFYNLTTDY